MDNFDFGMTAKDWRRVAWAAVFGAAAVAATGNFDLKALAGAAVAAVLAFIKNGSLADSSKLK